MLDDVEVAALRRERRMHFGAPRPSLNMPGLFRALEDARVRRAFAIVGGKNRRARNRFSRPPRGLCASRRRILDRFAAREIGPYPFLPRPVLVHEIVDHVAHEIHRVTVAIVATSQVALRVHGARGFNCHLSLVMRVIVSAADRDRHTVPSSGMLRVDIACRQHDRRKAR